MLQKMQKSRFQTFSTPSDWILLGSILQKSAGKYAKYTNLRRFPVSKSVISPIFIPPLKNKPPAPAYASKISPKPSYLWVTLIMLFFNKRVQKITEM